MKIWYKPYGYDVVAYPITLLTIAQNVIYESLT